ncbi:hypothetical protein [Rugosimonospora africana]|uniref:Uncharacterized protein n=1 Tax=Rugosimonospora africana TaxID=556532 RepID=A0A8J3QZB3_9ACTN|nr:hypothetical protein [Rugosimonospora africana]GIH18812.1 hypothetical protein Raf01_69840 [Rugosimonospora africana]
MTSTGVSETATGAASIGKYFVAVSLVPSTVLTAYLSLLVKSTRHSGVEFVAAVRSLDLRDAAIFGIASLLLALAFHPLQYALVQLFEGYWGTSRLAVRLAVVAIGRHRTKRGQLDDEWRRGAVRRDDAIGPVFMGQEARRLLNGYPNDPGRVLPTRLGNVLRHYEGLAGAAYGIESISSAPRIAMVAEERELNYLENQRIQLELAVRASFLSLVACAATVILMWRHGSWMLLAIVPYTVAYLSYRGAIVIAHEYGAALATLIDLNRFKLYDRLHLPPPRNLAEERQRNETLMELFRLDDMEMAARTEASLDYATPTTGSAATPDPSPAEATVPAGRATGETVEREGAGDGAA